MAGQTYSKTTSLEMEFTDERRTPFNNPLLMDIILGYSKWSQSDLASFRLVCKLWFKLTLSQWRSTAVLTLTPASSNSENIQNTKLSILDFLKKVHDVHDHYDEMAEVDILQLVDVPFQKFRLVQFKIELVIPDPKKMEDDDYEWQTEMDATLCQFLPHARSLHFDNCKFKALSAIAIFFHEGTKNLEEIKFTHCVSIGTAYEIADEPTVERYVGDTVGKQLENIKSFEVVGCNTFPFPLIDPHYFMRKFVLDSFKYWADYKYPIPRRSEDPVRCTFFTKFPDSDDPLIQAMQEDLFARQTKIKEYNIMGFGFRYGLKWENLSITKLDLLHMDDFTFSDTTMNDVISLHKLNLHLQSFAFQINHHCKSAGLNFLLSPYAETLKSLKIFRDLDLDPFEDFPLEQEFAKIEEIHLFGSVTSNLGFLRWIPNIEKLHINFKCFEHLDELVLKEDEVKITKNFKNMVDITEAQLGQNHLCLRKMKDLSVDYKFPVESLRKLKSWMGNLQKFSSILDNESFRAVCELWPNLSELALTFGSEVDDEGITGLSFGTGCSAHKVFNWNWNINNLSGLQKFQYLGYCDRSKLTDTSVYHGFLNQSQPLMKLHSICICVSPDFTSIAETALKENFMHAEVIRNYGTNGKHYEWACCRYLKIMQNAEGGEEENLHDSIM